MWPQKATPNPRWNVPLKILTVMASAIISARKICFLHTVETKMVAAQSTANLFQSPVHVFHFDTLSECYYMDVQY